MATKRKLTLSKSAYIRSLQCLKSLYLYKNYYTEKDIPSAELLCRFRQGISFGKQAWQLFPDGIDVAPKSNFTNAITRAAQKVETLLVENQSVTLYEASFCFQSILTILDILVKKNNSLFAYEVKSSIAITPTYLHDAAFQYYVMTQAGREPQKFYLVHLKEHATLDNVSLDDFCISDITSEVKERQLFVTENIKKALIAMEDDNLLSLSKGEQCTMPYLCDFLGFCTKQNQTENHV